MLYFLRRKEVVDYDYTLYHYGPYSFEVESILEHLKFSGMIDITWNPERGYFIKPTTSGEKHLAKLVSKLDSKKKAIIDSLIKEFGDRKAKDLSLIATVLYFHGKLPEEEIIRTVKSIKPQFSEEKIIDALETVKSTF